MAFAKSRTIGVRELDEAFEIRVTDDSVGFDPDAVPEDDGCEHTGISAPRLRLREMCGGTLEIASRPGAGTQAVIHISKSPSKEGHA